AYTTLLSLIPLLPTPRFKYLTSSHTSFLHLLTASIYLIRDLAPLAADGRSMDQADGPLGWARFALVIFLGFLVPGLLPRKYEPADPENPIPPTASQTSSYISLASFSYLDSTIFKAYKSPSLTIDQLPSLSDDDRAEYLEQSAFRTLDPVRSGKRHWSFLFAVFLYFKKQYAIMSLLSIIEAINEFAGPIATNRILAYLEGDREILKPWIWILWLGAGPILSSVCQQTYLYFSCKVLVRVEGIITQLVFVHSLRVRLNTAIKPSSSSTSPSATTSKAVSPSASGTATPALAGGVDTVSLADTEATLATGQGISNAPDPASTIISAAEVTAGKGGEKKEEKDKGTDQIGKINNMISTDLKNLQQGLDWMEPLFVSFRIIICVIFLYLILGWSAFVGLGVFVCMIPVPGLLARWMMRLQEVKMKKSDARIAAINQIMNVLRMIKIFAWESKVDKYLWDKREDELKYILRTQWLGIGSWMLNSIFPLMTMISTFATYTLIMKKELTASTIYSAIGVFNIFENNLFNLFYLLPAVLRAKVSLDRVGDFINNGELFSDSNTSGPFARLVASGSGPGPGDEDPSIKDQVLIRDAVFSWDKQPSSSASASGSSTPATPSSSSKKRNFRLTIDGDLSFKSGSLNLIIGPTGSGKTSLLMALLGEMYFQPTLPTSLYNLPRQGGVAYAAQETWVLNETIRDNILFGAVYDKERFDKVIYQTALTRDLTLFEAGELTEVGEKGITLSGGQKARITLARAVYSPAQILLLDDVLSALDVHTARWVAQKCLGGDLLKGRTTVLVTHNVGLVAPYAEFVVALGTDGRVVGSGSVQEVCGDLGRDERDDKDDKDKGTKEVTKAEEAKVGDVSPSPEVEGEVVAEAAEGEKDGKLIVAEEMAFGHVSWGAMKMWLVELGGPLFFFICIGGVFLENITSITAKWFLGYWSSQYQIVDDPADVPVPRYLGMYAGILLFGSVCAGLAHAYWVWGSVRASRTLHERLIRSILTSTFRWLDTVPISRVLSRCSQDCQTIDGQLSNMMVGLMYMTAGLTCIFFAVITQAGPIALIPATIVVVAGLLIGQVYIAAQLPIKRNMSNSRSPVLSHVGAALNGLISIRAYGAQEAFRKESIKRIDNYTRAARTYWNVNRWIGFRMDTLGGIFTGVIAAYVVYWRNLSSGNVGFTLVLMTGFSFQLLMWIRMYNEIEVQGNSLERIQDFLKIDHEPPETEDGKPPAYWPASGELIVKDLSARYSADGPEVLKNINFHLKSGERMGIVGRTGAGKSTVALALLRAIPTTGSVIYDSLDASKINLHALRSNITVIPQHPELLSGTLRENLDPFQEHDDAVLNDALRAAGFVTVGEEEEEGGITLDTEVASGGSNFSQGQRQIVAIARAILRRSKVVILDEATAAIDYETDHAIQESLRTEFKDATVITVAHRLQTIMASDKIMVLDAGETKELDSPKALLQREGSFFKGLVDESSDRDKLYKAAGL
ncbi:P-loop containing nucleoside triphosphate hydrolase protein, partial [Sistotremastrum niveocremeum HHB9708]